MKILNYILFVSLIVILLAGQGFGQEQRQRTDRLTELKTRLNLNDTQFVKAKEIMKSVQEKMQTLRGNSDITREERMAKIKEVNDFMDSEFDKILNDDQKKEYEKIKEERVNRFRNRNNNQN